MIGDIHLSPGDYTIYVNLEDADTWELIINKQTGQGGLTYDAGQDVGRAKMTMSKPASKVETLKYTLTADKLELAWDEYVASAAISAIHGLRTRQIASSQLATR